MNTVILYATKHGTAKKCAEILSGKLSGNIDLYNIKDGKLPELSLYDKVIIGGSIYAGTIQKEISDFCLNNLSELSKKKIGLYICCMNKKEADKQLNRVFPQGILQSAIAKVSFGGEFKFKEMNFMERFITKIVSKSLSKEDPSLAVNTRKDLSMISEDNINSLAKLMNNAS